MIADFWLRVKERWTAFYNTNIKQRPGDLVTIRWLSSRHIRQAEFAEILSNNRELFGQAYIDDVNKTRSDYEKIFWKVGLFQFTLTGILVLYLMSVEVSFSFLGFSSQAIGKLAEFVLFAHGVTIGYSIVLQQLIHKLEDVLFTFAREQSKERGTESYLFYALRYASPTEAMAIDFLPSSKHDLFQNDLGKFLEVAHGYFRAVSALGFAALTMVVPLIAAIVIAFKPSYGVFSYLIVAYWFAVGIYSVLAMLKGWVGIPFTDYSYSRKLAELETKDPAKYHEVIAEAVRTNAWPRL